MTLPGRTEASAEPLPNPLAELSLARLRTRTSVKWRAFPPDVLPLWVAEMDVRPAAPVTAALTAALESGDTGYPMGDEYGPAFAAFAADRWSWDVAVERTSVVADVMNGIVQVLRLVTEPGDPVVVNAPVYPPFYAFVEHDGRRVVEAPLGADGRLDLAVLADTFVSVTRSGGRAAFLICNPHNPTGVVHTPAELTAVAELARRYGVRVVADEIHAPLVLAGAAFTPYLSVPGAEDAFSVFSASKAWNLAGLKAAVIVAGPDAAADLARIPEEVSHGPSHLGVLAHTVALREGADWLNALLRGLDENRRLLGELLAEHLPRVGYRPPEATYLAWLDCRSLDLGSYAPAPGATEGPAVVGEMAGPAQLFLDLARVALSSGHAFGSGGSGRVRLNFATSPAVLTEAVQRMGRAAR